MKPPSRLIEAISKGVPLTIKIGTSSSYAGNVFWPKLFVGALFQILEILEYSSGLKHGSAAILTQNPIFEMVSSMLVYLIRGDSFLIKMALIYAKSLISSNHS